MCAEERTEYIPLMKKKRSLEPLLCIISILLVIALSACGGKDGQSDGTDAGSAAGDLVTTTEPETEYVPVMDPDADEVDGIAIRSADDLAKIGVKNGYPLDGDYVLVIDLDLSGRGWEPICGAPGTSGEYTGDFVFSGTFDGRGHKIKGLTIDVSANEQSYWGLFGSVGSADADDPAVIKNIVFVNSNVSVETTEWTGVGVLAGQVNGYAEIDSIALLSGSVKSLSYNAMNIGTGSLLGQCRTAGELGMNGGIKVTNIFSNVDVTCENYGIDMGGGVIGRIRGSNMAELSDVLYVGKAVSEGGRACAIASGDSSADSFSDLYYRNDSGVEHNGLGDSVTDEKLTGGALSFSDLWIVRPGMYPLLTAVAESSTFSISDFITIGYADGDSAEGVRSDFTLPSGVLGMDIKWSSGDASILSVSGGKAGVIQPSGDDVRVTLTADYGSGTQKFSILVIGTHQSGQQTPGTDADPGEWSTDGEPRFVTTYVEAGKPIELAGYAEGTQFEWVIENYATGDITKKKTNTPSLTLTESDSESMITVKASGYKTISIYYSYLPIINITSDLDYYSIKQDGAGSEYFDVEMTITAGEEYADGLYDGGAKLHLRGNSTAGLSKKPFKLKLDQKANLLGIDEGASKHWVLLANAKDSTLMRNKLLTDFSRDIGMDAYVSSENVTLIYNGDYLGVYELIEHVRVGETRVNVFDWEDYAEDAAGAIAEKLRADGSIGYADARRVKDEIEERMLADWSWMKRGYVTYGGNRYKFADLGLDQLPDQTGGFLLEMDFYHMNWGWDPLSVQTAYAQPLYFNTPETSTWEGLDSFSQTALYRYAANYVQSFEYAVHSDDFFFRNSDTHYAAANWWDKWAQREYYVSDYKDDVNDGKHYSELFDLDNLVQNFIFVEVSMNWDSMKNSMFVYKDIDGLAKLGPQWDFDWAWGNVNWMWETWDPENWHCRDEVFMREQYYQEVQWNCLLIRDPYFLTKVWETWQELRDDEIEALVGNGGIIDTYAEYIRRAALANDARWYGETPGFDYDFNMMKEFVSERMNWLDRQFDSLDTLVESLGVYHASDKISVPAVNVGGSSTTITVKVTDSSIKYVNFQINGTTMIEAEVKGGEAKITVENSKLDADGYNCVVANAMNGSHKYIIDAGHSIYGNYNQVVSNYRSFTLK